MQCCGLLTGPAEKTLRPSFSVRKQTVEVLGHEHVSISMAAIQMSRGQRMWDSWSDGLRTSQNLSHNHLDFLLY